MGSAMQRKISNNLSMALSFLENRSIYLQPPHGKLVFCFCFVMCSLGIFLVKLPRKNCVLLSVCLKTWREV